MRCLLTVPQTEIATLAETSFAKGLKYLSHHDPDLAQIFNRLGAPAMWLREPGFPTLILTAIFRRFKRAAPNGIPPFLARKSESSH